MQKMARHWVHICPSDCMNSQIWPSKDMFLSSLNWEINILKSVWYVLWKWYKIFSGKLFALWRGLTHITPKKNSCCLHPLVDICLRNNHDNLCLSWNLHIYAECVSWDPFGPYWKWVRLTMIFNIVGSVSVHMTFVCVITIWASISIFTPKVCQESLGRHSKWAWLKLTFKVTILAQGTGQ